MEEFSAMLRGEELRREAEAWRRLHAAAGKRHVPARERIGWSLVHLGERLIGA
jgi:hypothetical protein